MVDQFAQLDKHIHSNEMEEERSDMKIVLGVHTILLPTRHEGVSV